jgi:hypothetical protein
VDRLVVAMREAIKNREEIIEKQKTQSKSPKK